MYLKSLPFPMLDNMLHRRWFHNMFSICRDFRPIFQNFQVPRELLSTILIFNQSIFFNQVVIPVTEDQRKYQAMLRERELHFNSAQAQRKMCLSNSGSPNLEATLFLYTFSSPLSPKFVTRVPGLLRKNA
uniref:Uncharacterized protein n=1 Tax=Myotis myotis TaxID=51298 RepID=A0A7J7Y0G9_MYOMY|nr:hypothetical protein mMyoMyo1_011536 [Myotis myotis]